MAFKRRFCLFLVAGVSLGKSFENTACILYTYRVVICIYSKKQSLTIAVSTSFSCDGYLLIAAIFPPKSGELISVFVFLCCPFHVLDTFWLLTYSWSGSVFCELMSDKNLQSCDFLQRLHKHEIRLEHVFAKSRWTVDVQSDKIGRAYENKGRLHIPQFHKSGFTLRKARSVDTYCTEWDQTGSFTDIHLQRRKEVFDTWKLLSSIACTEWRNNRSDTRC